MKRIALALALVALVASCKRAAQEQPAQASDTSHMMGDSTKMMGDSTKMMGDTSKMRDTTKHM